MNIERNPDPVEGGGLVGYIEANYEDLVEVFGPPTDFDIDGKVQAEWSVLINGQAVIIYDHKISGPYQNNRKWNIGGSNKDLPFLVTSVMKGKARNLTY